MALFRNCLAISSTKVRLLRSLHSTGFFIMCTLSATYVYGIQNHTPSFYETWNHHLDAHYHGNGIYIILNIVIINYLSLAYLYFAHSPSSAFIFTEGLAPLQLSILILKLANERYLISRNQHTIICTVATVPWTATDGQVPYVCLFT